METGPASDFSVDLCQLIGMGSSFGSVFFNSQVPPSEKFNQ